MKDVGFIAVINLNNLLKALDLKYAKKLNILSLAGYSFRMRTLRESRLPKE